MERLGSLARPKDPRNQDFKSVLDPKNPMNKKPDVVDRKVAYLVDKYKSPGYEPIFRKAVWRLHDTVINRIVAASEGRDSPRAYFIRSVKRESAYNS
jgi:hypothetical protein